MELDGLSTAVAAEPDPATAASLPEAPQTLVQAGKELLRLSLPFIVSSSCTTVQIFIDRIFVSGVNADAVAAAMPTVGYFWTPMALLHFTVLYATVFVAQYSGAGRTDRVGPVVWQAIYFAIGCGLLFPLLIPLADFLIDASEHKPGVKLLEHAYFRGLALAALPTLVLAAVNAFFAGRQQSWTVLLINAVGALTNALLAVPLILWQRDDPEAAMFGAGLATAFGSAVSCVLGLILFFRRGTRGEFGTLTGWRFDAALFRRLLYFGLPNGGQFFIEAMAFTAFIYFIGNIGDAELAATTLTFSLNLLTFLPVMGLGQGVEVLVGQRQGEGRPDVSARTTHAGAILATAYMTVTSVLYLTLPHVMVMPFAAEMEPAEWAKIEPIIPLLLLFVSLYSLADGANIIYAFGLRGAGDTRFVSLIALTTSWPLMVLPTWLCWRYGWGLYAAWSFATLYVFALAICFALRFRGGRWRTMRVIEPAVV
jgi:MATE family multidrug resistance protein